MISECNILILLSHGVSFNFLFWISFLFFFFTALLFIHVIIIQLQFINYSIITHHLHHYLSTWFPFLSSLESFDSFHFFPQFLYVFLYLGLLIYKWMSLVIGISHFNTGYLGIRSLQEKVTRFFDWLSTDQIWFYGLLILNQYLSNNYRYIFCPTNGSRGLIVNGPQLAFFWAAMCVFQHFFPQIYYF